jgi:hypothetical protein
LPGVSLEIRGYGLSSNYTRSRAGQKTRAGVA